MYFLAQDTWFAYDVEVTVTVQPRKNASALECHVAAWGARQKFHKHG
jgi:hypothetical protein